MNNFGQEQVSQTVNTQAKLMFGKLPSVLELTALMEQTSHVSAL